MKCFRPYLPLDMEAMPDPGFLALHGPWELLKSISDEISVVKHENPEVSINQRGSDLSDEMPVKMGLELLKLYSYIIYILYSCI